MLSLQEKKRALAENVVGLGTGPLPSLAEAEVLDLFGPLGE
jgi:hypothetical protein